MRAEEEREQGKSPNGSHALPWQGYRVQLLLAWASAQRAINLLFQVFTVRSAGWQHNGQAAPFRLTAVHHALLNYISFLNSSGISQKPAQLTYLTWYDHHSVRGKSLLESVLKMLKTSAWTPAPYIDFYIFTVVHKLRRTGNYDSLLWIQKSEYHFQWFFFPTQSVYYNYFKVTTHSRKITTYYRCVPICIDTYIQHFSTLPSCTWSWGAI